MSDEVKKSSSSPVRIKRIKKRGGVAASPSASAPVLQATPPGEFGVSRDEFGVGPVSAPSLPQISSTHDTHSNGSTPNSNHTGGAKKKSNNVSSSSSTMEDEDNSFVGRTMSSPASTKLLSVKKQSLKIRSKPSSSSLSSTSKTSVSSSSSSPPSPSSSSSSFSSPFGISPNQSSSYLSLSGNHNGATHSTSGAIVKTGSLTPSYYRTSPSPKRRSGAVEPVVVTTLRSSNPLILERTERFLALYPTYTPSLSSFSLSSSSSGSTTSFTRSSSPTPGTYASPRRSNSPLPTASQNRPRSLSRSTPSAASSSSSPTTTTTSTPSSPTSPRKFSLSSSPSPSTSSSALEKVHLQESSTAGSTPSTPNASTSSPALADSSGLATSRSSISEESSDSDCSELDISQMLEYMIDVLQIAFPQIEGKLQEDMSLATIGLQSSEVIQFKNVISSELQVPIPTIVLFDAGTLRDLAARLASLFYKARTKIKRVSTDSFSSPSTSLQSLPSMAANFVIRCIFKGFAAVTTLTLKISVARLPTEWDLKALISEKSGISTLSFSVINPNTFLPLNFPLTTAEDLPDPIWAVPQEWTGFCVPSEEFTSNLADHSKKLLSKLKKNGLKAKYFLEYLTTIIPLSFQDRDFSPSDLVPESNVIFTLGFDESNELRAILCKELGCPISLAMVLESKSLGELANGILVQYRNFFNPALLKRSNSSSTPKKTSSSRIRDRSPKNEDFVFTATRSLLFGASPDVNAYLSEVIPMIFPNLENCISLLDTDLPSLESFNLQHFRQTIASRVNFIIPQSAFNTCQNLKEVGAVLNSLRNTITSSS